MTMTREDQLFAMTGATLIMLADKLGVKVSCNRTRTALKEAKENVIKRILEKENEQNSWEIEADKERKAREQAQKNADKIAENTYNEKKVSGSNEIKKENSAPGRGAQLEFEGRSQNICTWAKELGISANTLYGRIYKMGWSIDKAFTTPARSLKNSKA